MTLLPRNNISLLTTLIVLSVLCVPKSYAHTLREAFLNEKFKIIDSPFTVDEYQLGQFHTPKDHITLKEPFILIEEDDHVRVSPFLKSEQDTLLRMNDLSYKLIKNADAQIKLTVQEMEQLKAQGWMIRGFSGLEGRRNTYPDLSGMIFYHPKNHLIAVVYRGTAGNKDGWDTNFDASKMSAHKAQKEFCKDLFEEVLDLIRHSENKKELKGVKKIVRSAQKDDLGYLKAKETYSRVHAFLKAHKIDTDLSNDILKAFSTKLDLMKSVDILGSQIEGEVHKGFLKKYLSTKREVMDIIKTYVASMSAEEKSKLKIVFTGHSQAGGTGNLALADICGNHGKEIFGANFNNHKQFKFYGYFLSAARAGDKEYKKWVHDKVGKDFIIRQNVEGDPAPVSSGDEKMGELVNRIPVVGEILAKNLAQYDDTGHLLLDDGHKVWKRARDLYEREGHDISTFEETEDLVRYVASWVVKDEKSVPKFLAPQKEGTSFIWSPIKWTKKRIKTASTINLLRKVLMGDEEAIKELEGLSETIMIRYAHLHYGHFRPETGAAFDPEVVGRDLDGMAKRGRKHQARKEQEKKGSD